MSRLLCQSSLRAHAVSSMAAGVCLFTNWKAHNLRNARVAQMTSTSFRSPARYKMRQF